MKTNKTMLCVLGSMLLFTVAAANAADAPKLTFKFKTINLRGALQTQPNGINDQGVIVGQYLDSSGFSHGYIWEKGKKLVKLDDPNGTSTGAYAINSNYNDKSGEMVVGTYTSTSGTPEGFLYNAKTGKFKDIKGPNDLPSAANGINDAREIVGGYDHSGFLKIGKKYTYPLSVPGATETYAQDINNHGVIILVWVDSGNTFHGAYTRDNGKTYKKLKDVPNSGSGGSFPTCIDNSQDISFTWYDSNNVERGALCTKCLTHPHYHKFNYPKALQTNASCVNDKKTIVGYYLKKHSPYWSGFEATYK
jgi:hypothetical protein